MDEVTIKDLPIFQKKFLVDYKKLPFDIWKLLNDGLINYLAVQVIDVILLPVSIKDSVTSSTITHTPKVISGNFICGYRVKVGKSKTTYHSNEIETASNQTAYLVKIIARNFGHYGWCLSNDAHKLPLIILTPDKLVRDISDFELNSTSQK